jgi:hypothetical protein
MNTIKQKRVLLIIVLIMVAVLVFVILITGAKPRNEDSPNREDSEINSPAVDIQNDADLEAPLDRDEQSSETEEDYVQILNSKYELENIIGFDAILPELYQQVKEKESQGKSTEVACEEAIESILERESMYWYASNKGFTATDAEIQACMDDIITVLDVAVNGEEIKSVCDSMGILFEDIIHASYLTYMRSIVNKKYYDHEKELYMAQNDADTELTDTDQANQTWLEHWKSIKANIWAAYKESAEYELMKNDLSAAATLIRENNDIVNEIINGQSLESIARFP